MSINNTITITVWKMLEGRYKKKSRKDRKYALQ